MVEFPQIQAGQLFDFLETVDQRVSMYEQLSGGLGNVEVVFKELVDGEQGLLVEGIDGILLEDLGQEDLAQGRGQLIDQAADTEIFIVDDVLLGVEDLAEAPPRAARNRPGWRPFPPCRTAVPG